MSNRPLKTQIRDARSLARMSQSALAGAMGVARQAVSNWENGTSRPTEANLGELRRVLGAAFGNKADATFSALQRVHGRIEELEALQRYIVQRRQELEQLLREPDEDAEALRATALETTKRAAAAALRADRPASETSTPRRRRG